MKRWIIIGVVVVIVVVIALVGYAGYRGYQEVSKAEVAKAKYDRIQLGQSRSQVEQTLGKSGSSLSDAFTGGPPEPAGSECRWYLDDSSTSSEHPTVFRVCYRNQKLVEKVSYKET